MEMNNEKGDFIVEPFIALGKTRENSEPLFQSQPISDVQSVQKVAADKALADLNGLKEFYQLRKTWSRAILSFIIAIILFDIIFAIAVGLNWLNFEAYPWILPIIETENFMQVIGLAIIVVKFLFDKKDSLSRH